jgi:hypothetical protein
MEGGAHHNHIKHAQPLVTFDLANTFPARTGGQAEGWISECFAQRQQPTTTMSNMRSRSSLLALPTHFLQGQAGEREKADM